MNFEEKKRKHLLRLILTEILMTIAIILMAVTLTLLLVGYRLGNDWNLEQTGMVVVDSIPRGALAVIDDGAQVARTRANKMLSDGKHKIVLTKEGYTSWEKYVNVKSGWMRWLGHARLFKNKRQSEKMQKFKDVTNVSVAPSREAMLIREAGQTSLQLFKLRNDRTEPEIVELGELVDQTTEFRQIIWGGNNRIVAEVITAVGRKWLVVDLKYPKKSYDLTARLTVSPEGVKFVDEKNVLYLTEQKELWQVDLTRVEEPAQLVMSDVQSYTVEGQEVVYLDSKTTPGLESIRELKMVRLGEKKSQTLKKVVPAGLLINLTNFNGEKYLTLIDGKSLVVYKGELPQKNQKLKVMEKIKEQWLDFVPTEVSASPNGQFLVMNRERERAILDFEQTELWQYRAPGQQESWLDNYLFATTEKGQLKVWDFDGTNYRTVLKKKIQSYPAVISSDDRFMYYMVREDAGLVLKRDILDK